MNLGYLRAPDRQHPTCQYHVGVGCFPQDFKKKCEHCGWNPEVEKVRAAKLRAKLNLIIA